MIQFSGKEYSKEEIKRYFGSLEQIAGVCRFKYEEGRAKGLAAIEFRTGTGFRFIVLPDRGLDIGLCEYKGMPISFRSPTGESSPQFFEPEGEGWLRNFGGGLLVTCGLTYLGRPSIDKGEKLGLHGRINNIPAEEIGIEKKWKGDRCILKVRGNVRETKTLSTNLILEREIWTEIGKNHLYIKDIVANEGSEPAPHMILYHINIGHPILDEGTELIINSDEVKARDEVAEGRIDNYKNYREPTPGYPDTVFYHKPLPDENGWCKAGLANMRIDKGVYVYYKHRNLPNFIQWKYTNEGSYVTGLEPANCLVDGRAKERERGNLIYLQPGEEKEYLLEIGILTSKEDINRFKKLSNTR